MALLFPGAGQMSPAVQTLLRQNMKSYAGKAMKKATGKKKRAKKRKAVASGPKKRYVRGGIKRGQFTKGSAAAKAWGKKMQAARKKKAKK